MRVPPGRYTLSVVTDARVRATLVIPDLSGTTRVTTFSGAPRAEVRKPDWSSTSAAPSGHYTAGSPFEFDRRGIVLSLTRVESSEMVDVVYGECLNGDAYPPLPDEARYEPACAGYGAARGDSLSWEGNYTRAPGGDSLTVVTAVLERRGSGDLGFWALSPTPFDTAGSTFVLIEL
jgi:hypothetical protein